MMNNQKMHKAVVAIGGNLVADGYSSVEDVLTDAISDLARCELTIIAQSGWFETAPVPISDQPWFVNGVLLVETNLSAYALLQELHRIEAEFGRTRQVRNEARILDLDLIDFEGVVENSDAIILPHPRMDKRAFVLLPLSDILPDWYHPLLQKPLSQLISEMPEGQEIRRKS